MREERYSKLSLLDSYQGGPLLVVLSGPSGVGKDAVLRHMKCLKRPWFFAVTATTRPQRAGEVHGVDYLFIEPFQFQQMVHQGEFLEHALVYGNLYGVPKSPVREALTSGLDVIIKADIQGAATIRKQVPQCTLVFLAPPSLGELERRLQQRKTESKQDFDIRIETAKSEMEHLCTFDYVVVNENDRLDETVAAIDAIIAAEKCRIPPRRAAL